MNDKKKWKKKDGKKIKRTNSNKKKWEEVLTRNKNEVF